MSSSFDNALFTFFPIFIGIVGVLIFSFVLFAFVKSIGEWNKNNHSPKLIVPASVISKRTKTSGGSGDSSASTWYYATFQVESGDRLELSVNGQEFGMLAEGDLGMLSFQGTRYLEFNRVKNES